MLLKKTRYPTPLPILSIFDPDADHGKFFRVDIDIKKFSYECEQKFENGQEIVHKIVTLTIFTFVKGVKLILSGKNTRI
jgi:hypothetical protein